MCDHRQLNSSSPAEIDHVQVLSDDIGKLYLDDSCSDITLIVGDSRFPAHRVILASRCDYFRALLFGGMRESAKGVLEVDLHEDKPLVFQVLLNYIYTGRVHLSTLREEQVSDLLGLANKYGFASLENAVSEHLRTSLTDSNVCSLFDLANVYSLEKLEQDCLHYVDIHSMEIIHSDAFFNMTKGSVERIVGRSSFCAPEISIFEAAVKWAKKNDEADISDIIKQIRFSLMSLDDLLRKVRPSGLVNPDQLLNAIDRKIHCKDSDLEYRGALFPEENMASVRHDAVVIKGEMKTALLDGDATNFDLDRGYTRHGIDDGDKDGIIVQLGQPVIINTIRLLLWDKDVRSYSYYIDVSMDGHDWMKVIDHSKYLCRSWQKLHFSNRVVKFIRIVGTHNTVNRIFHAVALEAFYTTSDFNLDHEGLLIPSHNVATEEISAFVIEGVSRTRNSLINGDVTSYDWDSGYTCHQLGSGSIIIQLAQPFVVGSMRLLLWDRDARAYSFTIEVSVDNLKWSMVTDHRNKRCQGWQTVHFEPRPLSFVKIVGTSNSANEVFHLVHFECPASPFPPPSTSPQPAVAITAAPFPDDASVNSPELLLGPVTSPISTALRPATLGGSATTPDDSDFERREVVGQADLAED